MQRVNRRATAGPHDLHIVSKLQSASDGAIARVAPLIYHVKTIWLFTVNDLKTMVFPSTAFALFSSFGSLYAEQHLGQSLGSRNMLWSRVPIVIVWAWVNLLAFAVNNQRQNSAIKEDLLNKPWRPIPAGRMTSHQAKILGRIAYPISLITSIYLGGGFTESAMLIVFGFLYNDLRLGDYNWFTRNLLNACGFTSFAAGALEVILQAPLNQASLLWLAVIAGVVGTTVHIQDMYDQLGDSAAGRKTIPLIIGDEPARWTIVMGVLVWSYLCPALWRLNLAGYVAPMALGILIVTRSLLKRTVKEDRTTFKWYNLWLVCLYSLPLWKAYS